MTENVADLIKEYRDLLVTRAENSARPSVANRLWDQNHALYKLLRETPEGRAAIMELMDDPVLAVRLGAGVHSLAWDYDRAEAVLQAIMHDPTASLNAVTAEYSLLGFNNGTLDLDW